MIKDQEQERLNKKDRSYIKSQLEKIENIVPEENSISIKIFNGSGYNTNCINITNKEYERIKNILISQ